MNDPRVMAGSGPAHPAAHRIGRAVLKLGAAPSIIRSLVAPSAARRRYVAELDSVAAIRPPAHADAGQCLDAVEHLLVNGPPFILRRVAGMIPPALICMGLSARILRGRASPEELQTVTRGAPHNPTTTMDLVLWATSTTVREDAQSRQALLRSAPEELAAGYAAGTLPPILQKEVARFLDRYGFRCIGEIDVGVPRWSEDPTHILGSIANYARLENSALSPDAKFEKSAREAEAMIEELLSRVQGPRRLAARAALGRVRELIGMREGRNTISSASSRLPPASS
jgi:pyruvate,water dikinase